MVALSGDGNILAVSAPAYIASGEVLVFEWKGVVGGWSQKGSTIEGSSSDDNFGYSISISRDGEILAVGSNVGNVDTAGGGKVQIFEFANNDWVQLGNDIESDTSDGEFGYSVSLSSNGHSVAIGAKYAESGGNGYRSGQVQVFELVQSDGWATWSQLGQSLNGDAPFDNFGESVSLASGDTPILAVGAIQDGAAGTASSKGFVRLFRLEENSWQQIGDDIYSNLAGDDVGDSVAISRDGSTVVAGGDAGGVGQAGMAIVYTVCLPDEPTISPSTNSPLPDEPTISPSTDSPTPTAQSTKNLVVGALGGVVALFAVAFLFFVARRFKRRKHQGSVQPANEGNVNQSPPTVQPARSNDELAECNAELAESRCQFANVIEVLELSSVRPSDVAAIQVDNDRHPPRQNIQNIDRQDPPVAFDLDQQTAARHNKDPQQLEIERGGPEFKDQVRSSTPPP